MPQPASQLSLAAGTVLAKRYRIEELIGSGGYASVYRAIDMTLGYERAIKEVADADQGVRNQFRLEAELLINSKYPNIPHGYHLIEDRDRLYLVMDYVHGKDLEELLNESLTQRGKPLDEAQTLGWAIDICGALDEMHNLRVPVIHRDIKPANIKITPDGMPILIDFGLAKLHQKGPTMTAAQGVSPGFAPPEQYMAKGRTDARTDIYGLGATLYACLTGKDPPEAPARLMAQTGAGSANMRLVSVRKLNQRVSEETDRIVIRALELSPNNRQQSARQLRDELTAALQKLTGAQMAITPLVCHRCGTQNRPEADRCSTCGAQLRPGDRLQGQSMGPSSASDLSGKRAAVSPAIPGGTGGMRAVAKAGAAPARTIAAAALPGVDQRTGRQAAVAPVPNRPSNAPDDQRSGKQRAVARADALPVQASGVRAAVAPAVRDGAIAPLPAKGARDPRAAQADATPAKAKYPGAWIRLGETPVTRFGKMMLTLAGIEVLWGAMVVTLGIFVLGNGHRDLPVLQLATGWIVVVLLVSVLGAQALTRPVLRRGKMTNARRWAQGTALTLYTLVVQAAGIYGAVVFGANQPNPSLAVVAYLLFGISTLIAGIVGVATALG